MKVRWCISVLLGLVSLFATRSASASDVIVLEGDQWSIHIDPATLKVDAKLLSGERLELAQPLNQSPASNLTFDATSASWRRDAAKSDVKMALDGDALVVEFTSDDVGVFAWPTTTAGAGDSLILPMFEGLYVPANDEQWREYLAEPGAWNVLADLSMPFWAVRHEEHTVTYILTEPFNSSIRFEAPTGESVAIKHEHEFTRNRPVKSFAVRIELSDASPIAPAKIYRRYLQQHGRLVTLKEKIAANPEVEKLLGAPHIYLWGDATISRYDVSDFPALMKAILSGSQSPEPSMGDRIWKAADEETKKLLVDQPNKEYLDDYTRRMVAAAIDAVIETAPDREAAKAELFQAYPSHLNPIETWGDGVSVEMIRQLKDAGLDRAWLGAASYSSFVRHLGVSRAAIQAGYLIGPYDSYHSIHSPDEADTWETAQFDQELYESGPIVRSDGTKSPGFKKRGYHLSPIAARPYVERRVNGLLEQFDCNSWFVDCDAFGQLFDDYSPLHPATQREDMNARLSRLRWLAETHDLVVGSEGGASFAAPAIAFAHGMMSPVIAWGDPDLYDRGSKSPYALGNYYPPDAPAVFFKTAKLKTEHRRLYFDPRFRVPLYQAALHDCVVATHHWSSSSYKFDDHNHDRELLELLYNVPPLYHLNRGEWSERRSAILHHHDFFSPLHRASATEPMMHFQWLTDDRLVQMTRFGDEVVMIANFSQLPFIHDDQAIPPHSVWARCGDDTSRFQPQ